MTVWKWVSVPLKNNTETLKKRKRLVRLQKSRKSKDDEIKQLQSDLLFYQCPIQDYWEEEYFTI